MTGALVILAALIVIGALLYLTDVKYFRHHHANNAPVPDKDQETDLDNHYNHKSIYKETKYPTDEEICCGQHLVCEKTSLSVVSDEIVYYDDEELDRFSGRNPLDYSFEEIEEFRDVLLTLLPQDVAGWARSITLRKIELPPEVKDELFLIISEIRTA